MTAVGPSRSPVLADTFVRITPDLQCQYREDSRLCSRRVQRICARLRHAVCVTRKHAPGSTRSWSRIASRGRWRRNVSHIWVGRGRALENHSIGRMTLMARPRERYGYVNRGAARHGTRRIRRQNARATDCLVRSTCSVGGDRLSSITSPCRPQTGSSRPSTSFQRPR